MSFDLRIRFEGLVMWVPEGNKAMHVLMPLVADHKHHVHKSPQHSGEGSDTGGTEHHSGEQHPRDNEEEIPEHLVRVVVDRAYLEEGHKQLTRELYMVDLAGRVLDLTGLSLDGIEMTVPDEVPSLDSVAIPLDPASVKGKPVAPVAARVTMDAGAVTNYDLGLPFAFLGQDRRITGVVEWTIRRIETRKPAAKGGALCLRGSQVLAPEAGRRHLPDLFPVGNTIQLTVMHLVESEFPAHAERFNRTAMDPDSHFDAYFDLANPKGRRPKPPEPVDAPEIDVEGDEVLGFARVVARVPLSICGHSKVSLASG
jgi:hypothetical protein